MKLLPLAEIFGYSQGASLSISLFTCLGKSRLSHSGINELCSG